MTNEQYNDLIEGQSLYLSGSVLGRWDKEESTFWASRPNNSLYKECGVAYLPFTLDGHSLQLHMSWMY